MKKTKDNFSKQSALYKKFRPNYPKDLIELLCDYAPDNELAWDCAAGNGQVAVQLAKLFKKVVATDISERQLNNAPSIENVSYSVERAERASLKTNSVSLIVVAQAIHWFDFDAFFKEAQRVLKKDGVLAIIGYPLFTIKNSHINVLVHHFYENIIGSYWDPERKYIDERYTTIPFPFKELHLPKFEMEYLWSQEQILGYLESWSAVGHYYRKHRRNPVDLIKERMESSLDNGQPVEVHFELICRVGKYIG